MLTLQLDTFYKECWPYKIIDQCELSERTHVANIQKSKCKS